jgi:hypothetical protein
MLNHFFGDEEQYIPCELHVGMSNPIEEFQCTYKLNYYQGPMRIFATSWVANTAFIYRYCKLGLFCWPNIAGICQCWTGPSTNQQKKPPLGLNNFNFDDEIMEIGLI